MPEIKKSSKQDVSLVFLKWLVTVLSVVMILGFLFIITILGIKISNFNTTPRNLIEFPIRDIMVPDGQIENIDIEDNILTLVVKIGEGHLNILSIDLKDGILLNQYSIKQKKTFINIAIGVCAIPLGISIFG